LDRSSVGQPAAKGPGQVSWINFNADPRAPGHVTSCLQLMLFGRTRAICELKDIYNVQLKVLINISIFLLVNSMLSNTASTESVVKYIVCRLPAIAAILFHWITMKAVQQLTGLSNGPAY